MTNLHHARNIKDNVDLVQNQGRFGKGQNFFCEIDNFSITMQNIVAVEKQRILKKAWSYFAQWRITILIYALNCGRNCVFFTIPNTRRTHNGMNTIKI